MRIVYDDLVRAYLESLHSKLRNFVVEPEFLATWVHDEDDHVSLFELFAAAQSAGSRQLTVAVGAATAKLIDEARLTALLGALGTARISKTSAGLEIDMALAERVAPLPVAAPAPKPARPQAASAPAARPRSEAYRASLAAASASPRHEGPAPASGLVVEAAEGEARLAVAVDASGLVVAATHRGATGELRGALDGLCALLPGRPFREGRDHAVIRLEAALRDRGLPAPAAGVLTPKNADPVFAVPEKLLRAAYRDWAEKTKPASGWNFWDDAPGAAWQALSAPEKIARATAAVHEACRVMGQPVTGVEVLDVLSGCRIVLAATPETVNPSFAPLLMKLEKRVKSALDARLELQLESLEDRNRRAQRTSRSE